MKDIISYIWVQYLINNAGVAKWADLGSIEEQDMLHLFRTNTLGPLMITQEVLREGLLKSGSVVANMTSKVPSSSDCLVFLISQEADVDAFLRDTDL